MKTQDFTTVLRVYQTPEEVFNAINNVRGWWSEPIEGKTDELNSEFSHRDRTLCVKMKITQLSPQKIVWDIVESHNNEFLENINEWDGTRIVFEVNGKAEKTEIRFTHEGLIPQFECYKVCSKAWDFFISTSLKDLLETGKGEPIAIEYGSYNTSITVNQSPEEVFNAVNNARGWWLNNLEGKTDKLNEEFKFYENGSLEFHFRIIEMVPNEKVVWLVVDQNFKNTEKQEWKGSTLLFEISKAENKTQLKFTHQGLVPQLDCYEACENAWTHYIKDSLFSFIKKGKGQPNKW
jgi:hypothetical protein